MTLLLQMNAISGLFLQKRTLCSSFFPNVLLLKVPDIMFC